ncbi:ribonuclease hi [Plakobranchus ocellatus]|uniref:Ribonuclease hi n=1 Tax=Plakobranchus ocellatus TaxID=259542 RepID=A0AAV3Y3Y7_9GAST|nr:ribonuclease hi [Plakobranchus ocellatus]
MLTSTPFGMEIGKHEVLPSLGEDLHKRDGAGRKRETVMRRLRMGHTWLIQSYLLKNEEQPFCYACDSLYNVRDILIECPDFQVTRRKYFSITDLYRLFREVNPSHIVGYLKELGVYEISEALYRLLLKFFYIYCVGL